MRTLQLLRRLAIPVMALLCLLLSACEEPLTGNGPAGNETVTGTLADERGNFVPGALVEAINASNTRLAIDTSDDYGMFSLKGLPENLSGVQLRVLHSEFRPLATSIQEIVSMAGGPEGVLVNVLHSDSCCATISVSVANDNGVALGGVEVRLRRGDKLISNGISDSSGKVIFSNVCGGEFNLRLAKEGYKVMERGDIKIEGCVEKELEFSMRPAEGNEKKDDSCCHGTLRIIPRDSSNNEVITNAHVQIKRVGGNTRNEKTNGDGATFREMCAGTYNVRIAKEGDINYKVVEFQITLECNDSVVTERTMVRKAGENNNDTCCNGRVDIIPRDSANNEVLNGATVKLWKGNKLIAGKNTNDGHTVFEKLCAGEYSVSIFKDGHKGIEFSFNLECNGRLELTKTLVKNVPDSCCDGSLTVVVRDSTNNGVLANTKVRLWKNGVNIVSKVTNGDGVVKFEDLCSGKYGVDMIREGYKSREFNVTLECNQQAEITQKLLKVENNNDSCCNAKFKFRVKDSTIADGGWLKNVTVTIKKGDQVIATGNTNADGYYLREAICGNSTYTIIFSKDGFTEKSISITLTTCKVVEETIRIVPE